MCDECHTSPHLRECPNEPDPPAYCSCDSCDGIIYVGDEYYEAGMFRYCADCVTVKTAEEDEE